MNSYVESLHDIFAEFGPITSRRMFGGYGIYHQGLMFGLVADDTLYLKVDKQSADRFRDLDLEQFCYEKKGKGVKMSYFAAPEEIYEDREVAAQWARLAYEAAFRARKS